HLGIAEYFAFDYVARNAPICVVIHDGPAAVLLCLRQGSIELSFCGHGLETAHEIALNIHAAPSGYNAVPGAHWLFAASGAAHHHKGGPHAEAQCRSAQHGRSGMLCEAFTAAAVP